MRHLLIATAFVIPCAAAAQPYSQSMLDCASVYQNAAQWVNTDESADKLMHAATKWADAAVLQFKAEGKGVTLDAVWGSIDEKTEKWEAKGSEVFFSQDFRDWTQYCRKFAKDRGISISR